jgi:hypothetical protein
VEGVANQSATKTKEATTGDEVTTTAGGAGDGDAFRGGVCDRGDEV